MTDNDKTEIGQMENADTETAVAETGHEEIDNTEGGQTDGKDKRIVKSLLPYAGLPIILAAMIIIHGSNIDMFALLWLLLIIVFGYAAAVSDIKAKKIPNTLILAMMGAWVLTMAPKLIVDTENAITLLLGSLIGFAVGGGLFLLVYAISRKGLGGGDVKFMAAAGLYLGLSGTMTSMLYGTILAALAGLILILLKKLGRKDAMPLAPFIYAGILITVFYR